MSDQDELDLSALDPMEDPAHWRQVMAETLQRADVALARRVQDPLETIAAWKRPLLIAAAAAIALLIPLELVLETRESRVEQVRSLVSLSAQRDLSAGPPSAAEFLQALGAEEPR